MKIICNNCVGARLYQLQNKEFNNPFMWSSIYIKDFIHLAKNWDNINFNDIDLSYKDSFGKKNVSTISIDPHNFNIGIGYIHHIYENDTEFMKQDINIYSNHILDYINEKYLIRLDRMNNDISDPVFVFDCQPNPNDIYYDKVEQYCNLNIPYKRILICVTNEFDKYMRSDENLIIIHKLEETSATINIAKLIISKISQNNKLYNEIFN